jgi:hypothetical protein
MIDYANANIGDFLEENRRMLEASPLFAAMTIPTGVYGEPLPQEWDTSPGQAIIDAAGLTARPVLDDDDVEWLRAIRNTCRGGFSNDTSVITAPQQAAWWAANRATLVACLYADGKGSIVGYGLLRQTDDGRWWSSVAVLPQHGGRGYGGAITRHIIRQSPTGVVWATARNDNPPAQRLHCAADWDVIGADDMLTYYRTHPDLSAEVYR